MTALGDRLLVVSPHLDDGVFSLGAAIAGAVRAGSEVTVLTVLGCDPRSDTAAGWWDRRCGFETEGEAARARREEDRAACRRVGAAPRWLSFPDATYGRARDDAEVVAAVEVEAAAVGADVVLLPGFPLVHPDHAWLSGLLRQVGFGGARVGLYVEQPYAWRHAHRSPVGSDGWRPLAASLRDRRAKLAAARAYRSQLPFFGRIPFERLLLHETRSGGEPVTWLAGPE